MLFPLQTFVAAFAFFACTSASILLPASSKIIQGPSSKTTAVGSDGSVVDSVKASAKIISSETPALVSQPVPITPLLPPYGAPLVTRTAVHAPVLPAYASPYYSAFSAPAVAAYSPYQAPVVSAYPAPIVSAHSAPIDSAYSAPILSAHSAPSVSAYSAPVVASRFTQKNTVIAGPSGHIATSKTVAGPAVVAHGPTLYSHGLYH